MEVALGGPAQLLRGRSWAHPLPVFLGHYDGDVLATDNGAVVHGAARKGVAAADFPADVDGLRACDDLSFLHKP